ncbi:ATP11 protein-domain-containing protein [Amanita rubescens]|nr:ATP11 protein-domain-containing protein [Amanita rubescens]
MQRFLLPRTAVLVRPRCFPSLTKRHVHTDYELKYAEKLQKRANAASPVQDLKHKVQEAEREEKRQFPEQVASKNTSLGKIKPADDTSHSTPSTAQKERKDSSPIRALSNILDTSRIVATPHTPTQISALWNTYHLSRSGGTGRGFVCASIPVDMYKCMATVATRYPSFIVPVPRARADSEPRGEGERDSAYEFYYLQWDFHSVPPVPAATEDPFVVPKPSNNPPISTVLFTPLQEYKSRMSFATPYLVLTHYTDLAETHGIVLLRGEITPNSEYQKYIMTQSDAQLLSMAVQKFYLRDKNVSGRSEGGELLRQFHEEPAKFRWEDLLKHGNLV